MVHALEEAWRVLVLGGCMVDVRPLSVNVPLEVVHGGVREDAGDADLSPGLEYDIAADQAIEAVVNQGIFHRSSSETFNYNLYWKTFHGMAVDLKERWEGEINIAPEVLEKARQLYRTYRPYCQLCLPMVMRMGWYEKRG